MHAMPQSTILHGISDKLSRTQYSSSSHIVGMKIFGRNLFSSTFERGSKTE